jgi:hypothetical protein
LSTALLDDLLAAYVAPVSVARSATTPAKAAKAANREDSCGLVGDSDLCEALRIPAKVGPDSQPFAAVRRPESDAQSEHPCGLSQDSQDSQGLEPTTASGDTSPRWTGAAIAAFLGRRHRLVRWGWPEPEAERVAELLTRRDADDLRRACTECRHYQPGRCGNHRGAMLTAHKVGRDLAATLQRCPGFREART